MEAHLSSLLLGRLPMIKSLLFLNLPLDCEFPRGRVCAFVTEAEGLSMVLSRRLSMIDC